VSGLDYSVVIPAYNSEKTLLELVKRLSLVFDKMEKEWEVILVNDESKDKTWDVINRICKTFTQAMGISLMKNSGQHNALFCGLSYTRGDYVFTLDDDLQNPPEELPKLIEKLTSEDLDVVFAVSPQRKHAAFRNMGSSIINALLSKVIHKPSNLRISNFRMMTRKMVDSILSYKSEYVILGSLTCQLTNRIANVEVEHEARKEGASNYTLKKLIRLFMSNILNYSVAPLRFISYMGVISSFLSFAYLIVTLVRKLMGKINSPGFTTIIIVLLFIGGMTLLSFGILGEYIIRILKNSNNHPSYSVREKIGSSQR